MITKDRGAPGLIKKSVSGSRLQSDGVLEFLRSMPSPTRHYNSFSSEDSRVMLWDIRSAKGSLMVLDQHNGDTMTGTEAGRAI